MEVMARYGDASEVEWKVGRIMLKFRPIAPKPLAGGAVPAWPVETKPSRGRGKRKGGMKEGRRGRKNARKAAVVEAGAFPEENNNNNSSSNTFYSSSPVVTLPLMPVTPERKEESPTTPSPTSSDGHLEISGFGHPKWRQQQQVGTTTTKTNSDNSRSSSSGSSAVVTPRPVRPVGSSVSVECVMDTWREVEVGLASPAVLEKDTCPVFISDSYDRVIWTNAAYKRMVVGPIDEEVEEVGAALDGEEDEVMRVALVTRGPVPEEVTCFTCRMRVRYACRRGGKVSMAVPCDVWRLADGKLAWRLDVRAALSLSLGS